MFENDHNASPFNALPAVVVVLALLIGGVELVFQAAERGFVGGPMGIGWRIDAIQEYAFFDTAFVWMLENQRYPLELTRRFVTYIFIHGSFTHALFAAVMLLAIGKMVAEVYSIWAFLAITLVSTIVGSAAYGIFLDTRVPLYGAFPVVYGMIGALTFMLWVRAKHEGGNQFRAFSLIAFLMGIQLFFKLIFGGANDWVADIAGFVAGFSMSFAFAPGGAVRISETLNRIRKRR